MRDSGGIDLSSPPNSIQQLGKLGQSVWYDNMFRALIGSGELQRLIDTGVTGLTSNPTIFEKAISSSDDYDASLIQYAEQGLGPESLFESLAIEDIQAAADLLRPVYDETGGADGFASLEVNPHLAHDTAGTIEAAERLFSALSRPNVMIKVPATPEGIPAIRRLIGQGINVNVTLIFSLDIYARVRDAYVSGLEDLVGSEGDPGKVASVASFFVSRVDTAVDGLLASRDESLDPLLGKAAVANAKIAYQDFRETFSTGRFETLAAAGARVQRPLWASTSTKNPEFSDVMYVETLIGPDTVNTMPDATLTAFLEHGTAKESIGIGVAEAREVVASLESAGISMKAVTTQLMHDGVKAFADSFDDLIENIAAKRDRILAAGAAPVGASLGKARAAADEAAASLQDSDAVARIWARDHTLWSDDPTEIVDRLGWLDVASSMLEELDDLVGFADQVRADGIDHVVLLGMGGSSLGPEVLARCFGHRPGWPELIILDSTIPARIQTVADTIDPAHTMFVVSSKSGTTIETNALYRFFRSKVDDAVGAGYVGDRFVAVTDVGTALDRLAERDGFRRVFRNPPDIGGRYSVLSYFGLVPAALAGHDIRGLLSRAVAVESASGPRVPVSKHPGAWLGATIASLALSGRDKLTILTSPSLRSFGLWVEQLVAESLGKEGRGVIPIVGEPLADPDCYGPDRQFVYLKLAGEGSEEDSLFEPLAQVDHPVVRYELKDTIDLGRELYRWEFAVAVAGIVLGVNPFDQPNVQRAKDITEASITQFESAGTLPVLETVGSLSGLVDATKPGDYLAVLVYVEQTDETDLALSELRSELLSRHSIPTTAGYGPRYLHSTGQLYQGGPNNVSALVLTAPHDIDLQIPGKRFSFGTLADAQAAGDLAALRSQGRRSAAVGLVGDTATAIDRLTGELRAQ